MSDSDETASSLSDEDLFPISNPEVIHSQGTQAQSTESSTLIPTVSSNVYESNSQPAQRRNIVFQPLHFQSSQHNEGENSEGEESMSLVSRAIRRRSRGYMLLNRAPGHDNDEEHDDAPEASHDLLDIVDLSEPAVLPAPHSPLLTRNIYIRRRPTVSFIASDSSLSNNEDSLSSNGTSSTIELADVTIQADQLPPVSPSNSPLNPIAASTTSDVINAEVRPTGVIVIPPPNIPDTQSDFLQPNEDADRTSNLKRKLSPPSIGDSKKQVLQSAMYDDEESSNCPICFEPWSNCGNHRLTSLKCGHIFGQKCIERWLKDCYQKCPQCNAKAKKNDIRIIYAKKLQAIDTTDLEHALREADKVRVGKRECEMELAKVRMQYHMAVEECNGLKSLVSSLRSQLVAASKSSPLQSSSQTNTIKTSSSSSNSRQYTFLKSNVISQTGGCRVMDFHSRTQQFVVSQPSPHASFMNGFGVKRVSGSDFKGGFFTMLHQKAIKDLRFSHLTDHHLLSASQDCSLRITDLMSNAKIHEYKLGKPVWSCCWDRINRNIIYAGLCNGHLMQFDLRNTSGALSSMENLNSRCPIVSLYHVPPTASDTFQGRGGLFTGTLEGASFWQDMGSQENAGPSLICDFKPTLLPLEPGSCTGLQYCRDTQHCLVTYRPGRSYRSTTHLLCELQCRRPLNDAAQTITCNVVDTYTGGQSHKMLTRNSLFVLPDSFKSTDSGGKILQACVGDEANKKVHIYDPTRSCPIQSLNSDDGPPLDILPIHMESTSPMLAILSQSTLKVFKLG